MSVLKWFHDLSGRRGRRKLLAELRTLRHAEDDRLDDARRREFDALLDELEKSPAPHREAVAAARARFGKLDLGIRHRALREFLDLLLVVGAVAAGIRGLFLQPFRIPTGSMQPTLYGIHYQYKSGTWRDKLPAQLQFAFFGRRRAAARIAESGLLDLDSIRRAGGLFASDTSFRIGSHDYTLPGEPGKVAEYAELDPERLYPKGFTLADGFLAIGDHLFVERLSLYLRPPRRGDVTVFNTEGLEVQGRKLSELSGYYYIKRLVGLPGDTLVIKDNRLFIRPKGESEFKPADELDPRFKKIFSGKGGYQGYWNDPRAPLLGEGESYTVPEDHYFMLGDNSRFSLDGRFFGSVPRRNLVGRAFLVFWPFSRRWGLADNRPPRDIPTDKEGANRGSYRVMYGE